MPSFTNGLCHLLTLRGLRYLRMDQKAEMEYLDLYLPAMLPLSWPWAHKKTVHSLSMDQRLPGGQEYIQSHSHSFFPRKEQQEQFHGFLKCLRQGIPELYPRTLQNSSCSMECPSIHCHDSIKEPSFLFEQPLSVVQHTLKFIMGNILLLDKFHNFSIREALNGGNCGFSVVERDQESLFAQ